MSTVPLFVRLFLLYFTLFFILNCFYCTGFVFVCFLISNLFIFIISGRDFEGERESLHSDEASEGVSYTAV
jgi:hypothetical protein